MSISPYIARIFRSALEGSLALAREGSGGWTDARAGGILPLHPLIGYYIADYHFQSLTDVKIP